MCELMAMSFAEPISADFTIREFALRDEENADGWGLAWYPDQSVAVVKEPLKFRSSAHVRFLESYHGLASRTYIAHVRHGTRGHAIHADTHPFARELDGRDYCFAHNGTLTIAAGELPLVRFRPLGTTDSEYFFCFLLDQLARRGGRLAAEDDWRWLHEQLRLANGMGRLNCLLSDGQRLFGYLDAEGWKGLAFRKVHLRDRVTRHLEDPTVEVNLEGQTANAGYVIATRPLSPTGWHSFHPGELMVFEMGTIRFSSHRERRNERADAASLAGKPGIYQQH